MTTKSQKLCHLMIDPSRIILIEMSTISGLDPVKVPANRKDAHSQVLSTFAESDLCGEGLCFRLSELNVRFVMLHNISQSEWKKRVLYDHMGKRMIEFCIFYLDRTSK